MKNIKNNLREHSILIFVCTFYYMVAILLDFISDYEIVGDITFYYFILNKFIFSFFIIFISLKTIIFLTTNISSGPSCLPLYLSELRRDYFTINTLIRFGIVYLLIAPFMCSYSSIKQAIPVFFAFDSDKMLSNLDYLIHFNHNPWDLLQTCFGHPTLTRFIDLCYTSWGAFFLYTMLWMACSRRKILRLQFLLSLVLCWIVIGNVIASLLASAGPCYYAYFNPDSADKYATMLSYLRTVPSLQATRIQDVLWQAYSIGKFMPLGGISAMPSMHVSIAVLLALVYSRLHSWAGLACLLYAILIQIGSVHLGWHYAIDGYVSIVLTLTIWHLVGFYLRKAPHIINSSCATDRI